MSLSIEFTGVLAFVPIGKIYRVVAPSVIDAVVIHKRTVPPHVFHLSNETKEGRIVAAIQPNMTVNLLQAASSRDVHLFDGQHLTIVPKNTEKDPTFNPSRIVDVGHVNDKAKIDDGVASDLFDPDPSRVAGWFDLALGDIAADTVDTAVLEFLPKTGARVYRDSFAEKVIARLPDDKYTIRVRHFGEGRDAAVDLMTIDALGGSDVTIQVGNFPYEDLVNPESPRVINRDFELLDHHFHLFYGMCCDVLDVHPLPNRVSALPFKHRFGGVNCPPAYFGG